MLDIFGEGWVAPGLAYSVSVIGSYLGLSFTARARAAQGPIRWQWLVLAALALGGVAVWSMHFIAMMGYSVPGMAIRYDTLLTVVSGVTAVVVMGIALYFTLFNQSTPRLILSGAIAGLGVVSMHYTGMASMNSHGHMHHDMFWVTAASLVAVVASIAALWFAARLEGQFAIVSAAFVMAGAVALMHYTGMVGVHMEHPSESPHGPPEGASAVDLLLPLVVGLFVFMLICSLFLMLSDDDSRPSTWSAYRSDGSPEDTEGAGDPRDSGSTGNAGSAWDGQQRGPDRDSRRPTPRAGTDAYRPRHGHADDPARG